MSVRCGVLGAPSGGCRRRRMRRRRRAGGPRKRRLLVRQSMHSSGDLWLRLEQAFRGGGRAGGFVEQPQEAQVVGQALKYQSLHQLGQLFDAGRACIAEGQLGRGLQVAVGGGRCAGGVVQRAQEAQIVGERRGACRRRRCARAPSRSPTPPPAPSCRRSPRCCPGIAAAAMELRAALLLSH